MTTIRVLGLGNVLMGDDGAGPFTLQVLNATYVCPEHVSFTEVGTPGLDLIPYIDDANVLVVVDTVRASGPPGTIKVFGRDGLDAGVDQERLNSHDPGLTVALATLRLSGRGPADVVLVGVIPERVTTGIGLSPAVRAAVPAAVETVARLLQERGVRLLRREPQDTPDIWWERSTPRPAVATEQPACTK